jgi:hypothetical protein
LGEETTKGHRVEGRVQNAIGQPRCRLCKGFIEGALISVGGVTVGSAYYHEWCYEDRWAHIMNRLR